MNFFEKFKAPPAIEPLTDSEEIAKTYKYYRIRTFYACFVGYIVFHFLKKNLAVAFPSMSAEFGYTNTELGLMGASLYLTYGLGKFINGILADRANVRLFMPTALLLSAVANICFLLSGVFITPGEYTFFGLPSSTILLWLMVFFWGANGWFQAGGFPPIAKNLSYWFSSAERGKVWSWWSTSHQFGVLVSVQVSSWSIQWLGWKGAFIIPSILSIITALWLYNRLRDRPEVVGLPDIEIYNKASGGKCDEASLNDNRPYFQIFKESILCNRIVWLLAIAYIFVYVIRYGTEDWLIKFLVEDKGNSIKMASDKLSMLAFFGILGVVACGTMSDCWFKGKRAPVNIIYLFGVVIGIVGIWITPEDFGWLDYFFAALIGFSTGGPQMLIGGLCAIEASSKKVASAVTGFTGVFGYVGAVVSSVGTGLFIDKMGWRGAILFWVYSACACILICAVLLKNEYDKTTINEVKEK